MSALHVAGLSYSLLNGTSSVQGYLYFVMIRQDDTVTFSVRIFIFIKSHVVRKSCHWRFLFGSKLTSKSKKACDRIWHFFLIIHSEPLGGVISVVFMWRMALFVWLVCCESLMWAILIQCADWPKVYSARWSGVEWSILVSVCVRWQWRFESSCPTWPPGLASCSAPSSPTRPCPSPPAPPQPPPPLRPPPSPSAILPTGSPRPPTPPWRCCQHAKVSLYGVMCIEVSRVPLWPMQRRFYFNIFLAPWFQSKPGDASVNSRIL